MSHLSSVREQQEAEILMIVVVEGPGRCGCPSQVHIQLTFSKCVFAPVSLASHGSWQMHLGLKEIEGHITLGEERLILAKSVEH